MTFCPLDQSLGPPVKLFNCVSTHYSGIRKLHIGQANAGSVRNAEAARYLEALLVEPGRLSARDRADLVQAYGRLTSDDQGLPLLEQALADPATRFFYSSLHWNTT